MKHSLRTGQHLRHGVIIPMAAICLMVVLVFTIFTVDLGLICLSRGEAQNCADAAALSAAKELYPDPIPQTAIRLPLQLPIYQPVRPYPRVLPALSAAQHVVGYNSVAETSSMRLGTSDVHFQIYHDGIHVGPTPLLPLVDGLLDLLRLRTADSTFVNSCRVVVRKDQNLNGPLNLFFGPIIGYHNQSMTAEATAAIQRGYGLSHGDKMLPIAMDITIWNALRFTNGELEAVTLKPVGINLNALSLTQLLGNIPILSTLDNLLPIAASGSPVNILDGVTWNRDSKRITPGADGIDEVVLLADQLHKVRLLGILGGIFERTKRVGSLFVTLETGAGGGTPNAARLNQVIRNGLSASDVARMSTTQDGNVWLPHNMKGYFEIPTECEAALKEIIGQPRIIALYDTLPGTVSKVTDVLGFSHNFRIVGWGAVVVTEVNLTGPVRYINVQPAIYARHSIQPARGNNAWRANQYMSDGVYTTPKLVK